MRSFASTTRAYMLLLVAASLRVRVDGIDMLLKNAIDGCSYCNGSNACCENEEKLSP